MLLIVKYWFNDVFKVGAITIRTEVIKFSIVAGRKNFLEDEEYSVLNLL